MRKGPFSLEQADEYAIHCFDNKPLWVEVWRALCSKDKLTARLALAGASAQPKHYTRFLCEDRKINSDAPVKASSHFPCGWYGEDEIESVKHGKRIVNALLAEDLSAIHFHFRVTEDFRLDYDVYDPQGLVNSRNPLVLETLLKIEKLRERNFSPEDLQPVHYGSRLLVADDIFGLPPRDGSIVLHSNFVLGKTLEIAQKLNKGEPVLVEHMRQYSNFK